MITRDRAEIAAAASLTRGAGVVVAVVDTDVDVTGHPAYDGRVLAGRRALAPAAGHGRRTLDPHGTKVAGLILANDRYVVGVAPEAMLLPVGVPALGTGCSGAAEGEALRWASDRGADVIVCAWSPRAAATGAASRASESLLDALDHCLTNGRAGKGCVVVFSAGNDGSDLARNPYASYPGVIAVGACNCHGKHPAYSGWGDALWCVFPSNDPRDPVGASMTYLTTAPARSFLYGEAYYTSRFGFTSAACAAVAGICALILSANPALASHDVKHVLRDACDKIDLESGTYDEHGHSPLYGYGRPDIARAVHLAASRRKPRATSV